RGRVQHRLHGGARRQGCPEPDGRHAARGASDLVARVNRTHLRGPGQPVTTRPADHPTWSRVYIERIREAMRNGYQVRNIEHVVHGPYGLDRVLLISMTGIVENGHVLRFWGTGRDVTAMREAENALAQHDAQLRALATEITLAEERARRKLASELHDGPAQNLAGMAMQLAELKRKLQDREHLTLLDEAEQVLA